MTVLIKILQFVLSFSLLVIVHELGHFMFAKLFKIRVERFQLFFGKPWVKFRHGETEYGIGWIPFGGFVTLSGMIDESMNTDQMKEPPKEWEFRSKPAWQRLIVMLGGVFMNVVMAFVIYVGIICAWGDRYISTDDMRWGYVYNERAHSLGFEDGDRIVSIAGKPVEDYNKLMISILIEPDKTVVVDRGGEQVTIVIPEQSIMDLAEQTDFFAPRYPFVIGSVIDTMGAARAGIIKGDSLTAIDSVSMAYFDQFSHTLHASAGRSVVVSLVRDSAGVALHKSLPVEVDADGRIGATVDLERFLTVRTRDYTLWQSIPAGFTRVGSEISDYWKQVKMIVRPKTEAYKALGGPLSIGNIFPSAWNWESFWRITALLSIVLAVMNILPIPGLDGGHVLFVLVEIITRRRPSDKFLIYAQVVGMAFLVLLMIYATWNDISRLFLR